MNRHRFCLIWGVLGWGLPSALAFSALIAWTRDAAFLPLLGISLALWLPAGYLWGWAMWHFLKKPRHEGRT